MNKSFIEHKDDISLEEVNQMLEDLDALLYEVERFNEILAEKIINRHPIFCSFIRALLVSNCHATKATIQIRHILEKTLDSYLDKSDDNSSAHS